MKINSSPINNNLTKISLHNLTINSGFFNLKFESINRILMYKSMLKENTFDEISILENW